MREVKIDSMDCHAVQAPLAMTEKGKLPALSRKAESTSEKLTKEEINA